MAPSAMLSVCSAMSLFQLAVHAMPTMVSPAHVNSGCGSLPLPAADNRTRYFGRVDHTDPTAPQFSWVMSGVGCSFQAGSDDVIVYAQFIPPSDGARMAVVVDGKFFGYAEVNSSTAVSTPASKAKILRADMNSFTLAQGLSAGNHTIEVYKVTEDNTKKGAHGVMSFGGFEVAMLSGMYTPHTPPLTRRLEFIGDSDTTGWCADGSPTTMSTPDKYEDAYQTWAQQIARSVKADVMVEAVSGYGVTTSSTPIQRLLNNTLGFDTTHTWDYKTWVPDAVVILIGPNDEMRAGANGQSFVDAYLGLLNIVANNYRSAGTPPKIINVCGGSGNGFDPCADIQTAMGQFNSNNNSNNNMKAFYASITKANWDLINGVGANEQKGKSKYNGCDGHYNTLGHGVLANDILPQVKKIMSW